MWLLQTCSRSLGHSVGKGTCRRPSVQKSESHQGCLGLCWDRATCPRNRFHQWAIKVALVVPLCAAWLLWASSHTGLSEFNCSYFFCFPFHEALSKVGLIWYHKNDVHWSHLFPGFSFYHLMLLSNSGFKLWWNTLLRYPGDKNTPLRAGAHLDFLTDHHFLPYLGVTLHLWYLI